MIPDSFIQELLARIDIVDVVGRHVQLRKGGANLLGLCPFHTEKTPSFTVSPSKQFYHCFGCGAHGSAIRFLTEHTGATFPEAVRSLAASVGLQVPEEPRSPARRAAERERRMHLDRQQQILQQALQHYQAALKQAPEAIEYLKRRGLAGEVAALYGLGWASRERRGLASVFSSYEDPGLLESGLLVESDDGQRYDRFRGRIMFPIRNQRGRLLGFGGRLIRSGGGPKYLNSPETSLFSKGNELYGLHEAAAGIRAEGQVLVVEGYMDVVVLAQHGFPNAVATLGTATTEAHLQKLRRVSDRLIFSFDGDAAGRKAAWRALQTCLPWIGDDVSIRFLFLPEGHDPDSYVREFGAQALRASIDEAGTLSRFLFDELAAGHDLSEAEGRAACVHQARPLFARMPAGGLRLQLEKELASMVRLTPDELGMMLGQGAEAARALADRGGFQTAAPDAETTLHAQPPQAEADPFAQSGARGQAARPLKPARRRLGSTRTVMPMARRLLRLLLSYPSLVDRFGDQQLELLAHHPHLQLVRELVALVSASGATHAGALLQAADPDSDLALAIQDLSTELMAQDLPDPQSEWNDALLTIELQAVQNQCDLLIESGLHSPEQRLRYQELLRKLARLKAGKR